MKHLPRPLLIGGIAILAIGGPVAAHHFGSTPAPTGSHATTPHAETSGPATLPSLDVPSGSAGADLNDNAPDQQTRTGSPADDGNVAFTALAFAHAEFNVAGRTIDEWRTGVAALCTDVLAVSVDAADPPADGTTVNDEQPLTVAWIGERLAQVPIVVTMAGHPRVLTATVVEAGPKWLVSDVDLSQS